MKIVGSLILAMLLYILPMHLSAAECLDDEVEDTTIGGIVGAGVGVVSVAAISGATIALTATTGGALAVSLAVDCSAALCLPIATSAVLIGALAGWLFFADSDCAGAISVSEKSKEFYMSWNKDSVEEAREDNVEYCVEESGEDCELVNIFRHCAAVATGRDGHDVVFGIGTSRNIAGAEEKALIGCSKSGGSNCSIALTGECNDG